MYVICGMRVQGIGSSWCQSDDWCTVSCLMFHILSSFIYSVMSHVWHATSYYRKQLVWAVWYAVFIKVPSRIRHIPIFCLSHTWYIYRFFALCFIQNLLWRCLTLHTIVFHMQCHVTRLMYVTCFIYYLLSHAWCMSHASYTIFFHMQCHMFWRVTSYCR